jgi:hypothetical protein
VSPGVPSGVNAGSDLKKSRRKLRRATRTPATLTPAEVHDPILLSYAPRVRERVA